MNYVDQQTLKPDDGYVLPHRLWNLDVRRTRLLPPLSIFCCRLKSHLFSLSYPAFWLFSHLYNARAVTPQFGHYMVYNRLVMTFNAIGRPLCFTAITACTTNTNGRALTDTLQ